MVSIIKCFFERQKYKDVDKDSVKSVLQARSDETVRMLRNVTELQKREEVNGKPSKFHDK